MQSLVRLLFLLPFAVSAPAAELSPQDAAFFEKNIRPLLSAKCYQCHSLAEGKSKGGLTLDTRAGILTSGDDGPAIVPGKPDDSRLFQAISYDEEDLKMPPKRAGGRLTVEQIALVRDWITRGAPVPRETSPVATRLTGLTDKARSHWSLLPVKKTNPPRVIDRAWCQTPVDFFILSKLEAAGLKPTPPAEPEGLLRRMYYDMLGLPPTLEEVNAFSRDYDSAIATEQRYVEAGRVPYGEGDKGFYPPRRLVLEKWIDQLLANPHYGERWGRHWLDTARYADTRGVNPQNRFESSRYEYAWTYRDYVINAFNTDKPYDKFILEQLAADKLPDITPNDDRLAALGFLTVGKHYENRNDLIDERIDTTSKAFLGLTVSCARCHDHKFDPIPTADYYALHGVFNSIDEPVERPFLKNRASPADQDDYRRKFAVLEADNRTLYYNVVGRLSADLQKESHLVPHGYSVAFGPQSKEADDARARYGVEFSNELDSAIPRREDHPVFGPFNRLARLLREKPADFASLAPETLAAAVAAPTVNPIVARELTLLQPASIDDVGAAYARLFVRYQRVFSEYLSVRRESRVSTTKPDAATVELLTCFYPIPDGNDIARVEDQMRYYSKVRLPNAETDKFLFSKINELRITHPGAPGAAMVVTDNPQPKNSPILIRGDASRRGPVEPRHFLTALSTANPAPFRDGSGRYELAKLIATPANPLTARVAVNRVWQGHFGEGFVRTPDDLGNMSEPPSHPQLLDFLSTWFVENGWSLKKLHKLILLSSTYQQSANPGLNPLYAAHATISKQALTPLLKQANDYLANPQAINPDNRLLWRANLRRLDFESIRDSLILLTGKLDPAVGGKPVNITDEPFSYRRSIYGYVDRTQLSDVLTQFDFSVPDMPNSRRISTIVPQQALFFLNNPLTVDVARRIVARPEIASAPTDAARLTAIYRILFQRKPGPDELIAALNFLGEVGPLAAPSTPAAPDKTKVKKSSVPVVAPVPAPATMIAEGMNGPVRNTGVRVSRAPLKSWELLAQALLFSNEFVYVN
ncbi:MAG: PSD1 and planctomycete cytochrome C domain-containing protein [Opitutaceae bacterium]|jgi:hypothetical protein